MLDLQLLLKTKRFRNQLEITTLDLYTLFPHKDKVSLEQFKLIIKMFGKIFNQYITYSGHVVALPKKLGTLSIRLTPPRKNKAADYKYFRSTGVITYYQNHVTEGKQVKFFWDKSSPYCVHPNSNFFTFKPLRDAKHNLSVAVIESLTAHKYYPTV